MSKSQSYSAEFRAEAVKLVLEQGLSQEGAAKRLAMPKGALRNWVAVARSGDRGRAGARPVAELKAEKALAKYAAAFLTNFCHRDGFEEVAELLGTPCKIA